MFVCILPLVEKVIDMLPTMSLGLQLEDIQRKYKI